MALEKSDDCSLKAIVVDIVGQCERLGVSIPKLAFIKALAKDLPDAELFFDTADGSSLGIRWEPALTLFIDPLDEVSVTIHPDSTFEHEDCGCDYERARKAFVEAYKKLCNYDEN
ncbi:hypothetical protein QOT17_009921 [Balamuthia mandrillaris]